MQFMLSDLTIGFVASQLNISTTLLRKWEARYGFPVPGRNSSGRRVYSEQQLAMLREATRLMAGGMRPAGVFADRGAWLKQYLAEHASAKSDTPEIGTLETPGEVDYLLRLLQQHRLESLRARLVRLLERGPLLDVLEKVVAPFLREVGNAWNRGDIEVFSEHACSEILLDVLRQAPAARVPALTDGRELTLLLATPPGEEHSLGLAMLEAGIKGPGVRCVNLGKALPFEQLLAATRHYRADVVGVSLSVCMRHAMAQDYLKNLLANLPDGVELWLGGAGAGTFCDLPHDVRVFPDLCSAVQMLDTLRRRDAGSMRES